MGLHERERHALKARAHKLKPVVIIGSKGLHNSVINEIQSALDHHELIKIKIPGGRDAMNPVLQAITEASGAEFIQRIGNIATFYLKKVPGSDVTN